MKSWIWLRILSGVLAFFALGHTLGTAVPRATRGPEEAALYAAMQAFRFPIMGFVRSHWDFYRGFALTISLLLLTLAVLAWQLASIARESPRHALPMAGALQLTCLGLLALGCRFFFGAPIATSAVAVIVATGAVVLLVRERGSLAGRPQGAGSRTTAVP